MSTVVYLFKNLVRLKLEFSTVAQNFLCNMKLDNGKDVQRKLVQIVYN